MLMITHFINYFFILLLNIVLELSSFLNFLVTTKAVSKYIFNSATFTSQIMGIPLLNYNFKCILNTQTNKAQN